MDPELLTLARESILEAEEEKADRVLKEVESRGLDPLELLNEGFIPTINEMGEQFSTGRIFLPELILSAEVMKYVTDRISQLLPAEEGVNRTKGVVVIGTVEGDVHDIGKTLVVTILGIHGYKVLDLGRDVSLDTFVETAREHRADIVATSTLLTTTMQKQKELEKALKDAGIRDAVKTIVGGAPVTKRWADRIGADGYGEDALDAVVQIDRLLGRVS